MRSETKQGTNNMVAIAIAAFAVTLIAVFLAHRGSDVGQLPQLVNRLGGGPLLGDGIAGGLFAVLISLGILIAWFGVGNFAVSFIKITRGDPHSHILELAMKTAVGASIWSLVWFVLGVAGLYSRPVAVAAVIVGLGFSFFGFRRLSEAKNESRTPEKLAIFDKFVAGLITLPVLLSLIAALAPPTAKDSLLYHFAVPKAYVAQGSNAFIEGNIASYLALGTEMHSVWTMLLAGSDPRAVEAAAGATIWMFFPILLAVIFGWAREIGISRRWSLMAVLMVASVPTAYHVAASGYVDVAMALFVTLAVYALSRWWRTLASGWLVLVAIFLGAALSTKLTTVFVIAAFTLVILLRVRKAKESEPDSVIRILVSGFAALVLATLIASPWYLRTWKQTGSPAFPFYLSILPGEAPGWDVERSNLFQAMNSQYGGIVKSPVDYLLAPWNVSVVAQLEQPAYFDGVLAPAFLVGLPLLIWGLWKFDLPIEVSIGAGVAASVFLFWLFSSQQLRYLVPILPLLALGLAASIEKIAETQSPLNIAAKYSVAVAAICGILTTFAWFSEKAPLRVVLGGEARNEYLSRNLDYYPYYTELNSSAAPDAKVWLINMRRDTFHIDRAVLSDYLFEDWTLRKLVWESRNTEDLTAKARSLGVNYVLTRHDFLFDYDRSTLVDDKKPRTENEAKLRIAKEFILDKANTIRADEKFCLIKVN